MKQMYDGSQWVDTGETSVSTQEDVYKRQGGPVITMRGVPALESQF